MPELVPWPKVSLDALVNSIAQVLMGDKAMWRSAPLLYIMMTNPTQVQPQHAVAARIVVNLVAKCQEDEKFASCGAIFAFSAKSFLAVCLMSFQRPVATLGVRWDPPFQLTFLDKTFDVLTLTPKLLRRILRCASTQALYCQAIASCRKDLLTCGSGVYDHEVTLPRARAGEPWRRLTGFDSNRLLYSLTGALQTANRLYKAGLVDIPKCRFFGADEEMIQRLSQNCQAVSHLLGPPNKLFPDQPHFQWHWHGLWEAPQYLLDACKLTFEWPDLPRPRQHRRVWVWGDGSVVNGDHLFSKSLGLALIDSFRQVSLILLVALSILNFWPWLLQFEFSRGTCSTSLTAKQCTVFGRLWVRLVASLWSWLTGIFGWRSFRRVPWVITATGFRLPGFVLIKWILLCLSKTGFCCAINWRTLKRRDRQWLLVLCSHGFFRPTFIDTAHMALSFGQTDCRPTSCWWPNFLRGGGSWQSTTFPSRRLPSQPVWRVGLACSTADLWMEIPMWRGSPPQEVEIFIWHVADFHWFSEVAAMANWRYRWFHLRAWFSLLEATAPTSSGYW